MDHQPICSDHQVVRLWDWKKRAPEWTLRKSVNTKPLPWYCWTRVWTPGHHLVPMLGLLSPHSGRVLRAPSARVTWVGKWGQSHARPSPRPVKTNARDSWAHSLQTDVTGAWGALQRKGCGLGLQRQVSKGVSVSLVWWEAGGGLFRASKEGRGLSCLRAAEGSKGPSAALPKNLKGWEEFLPSLLGSRAWTRSRSSLFWRINFS